MMEEKAPMWLKVLAFLFPLAGGLYFVFMFDTAPEKAKSVGKAAHWGFSIGNLLQIIAGTGGAAVTSYPM
jgi:hypothetical protein